MNTPNISFCIGILAMSALCHWLPGFTRPDLYFGVTTDPAFRKTDGAARILRNYRIALWSSAIAACTLDLVTDRPGVALILYLIGICCAQVASHRRALIHAAARSTSIEVDLSAPGEHIPGGLLAALLPLVVLLGLGLWAVPHVNQLPSRVPVHWDFGAPNRWMITSPRTIIVLLAEHALMCLVLVASAWAVLHWSRRISISGPSAASERQFRRRTVLLILTAEYFTILPPILSLLQAPSLAMRIWSVAFIVTIITFVMSLVLAGQGGARRIVETHRGPIGDRTADARWIGGVLYFNPADPALLVEKRMGIGWTVNFGNPWSWVSVVAIAVILAVPLSVRGGSNWVAGGPLQQGNDRVALQKRSPSPGTEESLRRYILSLEQGHPNYQDMSPQLAAAVSRQLPKVLATINELGEFKSLSYQGTDAAGLDVYMTDFAAGRLEWHIGPLVDGKVTSRHFHALP
jgi:uncharacterized membrane protein